MKWITAEHRRRNVISLMLAGSLLLVLAGCGKAGEDTHEGHAADEHAPGQHKTEVSVHGEHEGHAGDQHPSGQHEESPAGEGKHDAHAGHDMSQMATIEGRAAVHLTAARRQLINIRTTPVKRSAVSKAIRTVGIVAYDTSKLVDVNTKINGWVETLYVDKPGQPVKKGEPLMDLYSRELYSGQQEYLLAYRHHHRLKNNPNLAPQEAPPEFWQENLTEAEALMESARRRLKLWDIPDAAIGALEESGKPTTTLQLTAPVTGFVVQKKIDPGKMVMSGSTLYRVADLSTVWVNADIYEYEVPLVKVGQNARLTLTAFPDRIFEAKVDFIYPYLESRTRTATLRLVLDNPGNLLKPDMYANVEIQIDLGEQLLVPELAVFDTGKRQYVFVQTAEGMFEPRLVKLGVKAGDLFVVREGLAEGELVVVDGNFLLDSESQLRAGGSGGHQH